jgi:iron-sulfur cluster assembly protein
VNTLYSLKVPELLELQLETERMSTPRPRQQVMKLTDRAAERIKAIMAGKDAAGAGLRVGVKKGGCAGMEYTLNWAEEQGRFDEVIEDKGARVLIDSKAVMFLLGTEMDYQVDKLRAGFVFNNPNQTSACGCGESVQLTPAASESVEV